MEGESAIDFIMGLKITVLGLICLDMSVNLTQSIMLEGLKVLFQCEGHNYTATHCKLAVSLPPDKDL